MALQFLSPIHRALRQITLHLEESMAELGIRTPEGHLLGYLDVYGPCPVGEVSRVFGWKKSTLTSVLDRLESRGLLQRSLNPDDRRSFLVELTDAGHELALLAHQPVDELERLIREQIGERDLAGFRRVMTAIDTATHVEVRPRTKKREKNRERKTA